MFLLEIRTLNIVICLYFHMQVIVWIRLMLLLSKHTKQKLVEYVLKLFCLQNIFIKLIQHNCICDVILCVGFIKVNPGNLTRILANNLSVLKVSTSNSQLLCLYYDHGNLIEDALGAKSYHSPLWATPDNLCLSMSKKLYDYNLGMCFIRLNLFIVSTFRYKYAFVG